MILQWNIRGFRVNKLELDQLASTQNLNVICLQETHTHNSITLKGYKAYEHAANLTTSGGSYAGEAILVKNHIPHSYIPLNTALRAVAVRVTLHKTISICTLYIPPNSPITSLQLNDLYNQLPQPAIILGDFNAHNPMWGGDKTDQRGKIVETFINTSNVCLLNDGSPTYLHPGYGTYTSIDLCVCSPSIFLDFTFSVEKDLCGSDHFPIRLDHQTGPSIHIPKWNMNSANWPVYQGKCLQELSHISEEHPADAVEQFTNSVLNIAHQTIKKTSSVPRKSSKPWFNNTCHQAKKAKSKALRKFHSNPDNTHFLQLKAANAKARKTYKTQQRASWSSYVSKLKYNTPIKQTWNMIRKITGKGGGTSTYHLNVNNTLITNREEIANALAENLHKNSSTQNYTREFNRFKPKAEAKILNFGNKNTESYNMLFSIGELSDSINQANNSSPGPDNIHYQLLKHLPPQCLHKLLNIFNGLWVKGQFPETWRQSIIIPIPKPGKDPAHPNSYRPIALTSCLCKIFERMINNRLTYHLEKHSLLTPNQSGFRKGRSTTDQLVRLETFIREAFIRKQHLVAVFFDLEKAYDTTWRYGIMRDLHDLNFRGRLPRFVANYLQDRTFQLRLGTTFSDLFQQENGVPQGSILAPTLFNIKINNVMDSLSNGIDSSLYVDDLLICYSSEHMEGIERKLQLTLNRVEKWANTNGFKFSESKTVAMHFCQKRALHPDPELSIYGNRIPVVSQTKFLGLTFDNKLTFKPHIHLLKTKCQRALNILKVVSNHHWGADRETLLLLYRSLVRSELDYGCIIYGSARK